MKSKNQTKTEIVVMPAQTFPIGNAETMLNDLIQRKVAEVLASNQSAIFEPFFQTKSITTQLRKLQSVIEQRKWSFYFEDHGCLICNTTDVPHASLGMCLSCLRRTRHRLEVSMRKRDAEARRAEPYKPARLEPLEQVRKRDGSQCLDLEEAARQALVPAIAALTKPRARRLR
jgi:hypothetical protein